jgi:hypothetical protein
VTNQSHKKKQEVGSAAALIKSYLIILRSGSSSCSEIL